MNENVFEVTCYKFNENVLVGKRKDGCLFWIKAKVQGKGRVKRGEFKPIEGGYAKHDNKTDTIIFGYPTQVQSPVSEIQKELVESKPIITHYVSGVLCFSF